MTSADRASMLRIITAQLMGRPKPGEEPLDRDDIGIEAKRDKSWPHSGANYGSYVVDK